MARYISFFIIPIFFISCKTQESKPHRLDFERFSLETPIGWGKLIGRGVDSYVGEIKLDSTDKIFFDFGLYSNDLEEYLKEPTDTSGWTLYPPLSMLGENRNSKSMFEVIDGKSAKIVLPINTGKGVTGIYFDSLKLSSNQKVKFEISGNNLKPENEKLVLKAFKTLKFNLTAK